MTHELLLSNLFMAVVEAFPSCSEKDGKEGVATLMQRL